DEPVGRLVSGRASVQDEVRITGYAPERVELVADLASPGWVVLTDTFYPGWQATFDGQAVDILQGNLMFRAVEVPAGRHEIIFEFRPQSLRRGGMMTGVSLFIVTAGLFVLGKKERFKR
ncbi:MAG: YfhO family protein, partial [Anaerolineae bacterium]|nr:YfhO family protein [Anaerolineae bacterium]